MRRRTSQPLPIGRLPKDLRDVLEHAQAQGWRLERRNGGHFMAYSPNGATIVTIGNGTQSQRRQVLADLRRGGLRWPPSAPA